MVSAQTIMPKTADKATEKRMGKQRVLRKRQPGDLKSQIPVSRRLE